MINSSALKHYTTCSQCTSKSCIPWVKATQNKHHCCLKSNPAYFKMFSFSAILCTVWANELQMETQKPTSFVTLDWLLNSGDEPAAHKQKLYDLKTTKTPLSCFPPHRKTHRTLQCTCRLKRKPVLLSLPRVHPCVSSAVPLVV